MRAGRLAGVDRQWLQTVQRSTRSRSRLSTPRVPRRSVRISGQPPATGQSTCDGSAFHTSL